MENKNAGIKNVHEDVTEEQAQVTAKIAAIQELLNTEPKAIIDTFLSVTEKGIAPMARVVLVAEANEKEDDSDNDEETTGEDSETIEGGGDTSGDDGSDES